MQERALKQVAVKSVLHMQYTLKDNYKYISKCEAHVSGSTNPILKKRTHPTLLPPLSMGTATLVSTRSHSVAVGTVAAGAVLTGDCLQEMKDLVTLSNGCTAHLQHMPQLLWHCSANITVRRWGYLPRGTWWFWEKTLVRT